MAWIVAVASLKGGVGKSTIALTLATTLHDAGHRVLVVDCDPQGTCRTWASHAAEREHDGPAVVALNGAALRRDLPGLATSVDVVVIDSPPRMGAEARATMVAADLVLLPTVPGAADLWALQETIGVLNEARALRDVPAAVVLNRADRTVLARMALDALADLGVPVLPATLGARVAFGEATLAGLGVVAHAPASTAAEEARELARAVLSMLGGAKGATKGRKGSKRGNG